MREEATYEYVFRRFTSGKQGGGFLSRLVVIVNYRSSIRHLPWPDLAICCDNCLSAILLELGTGGLLCLPSGWTGDDATTSKGARVSSRLPPAAAGSHRKAAGQVSEYNSASVVAPNRVSLTRESPPRTALCSHEQLDISGVMVCHVGSPRPVSALPSMSGPSLGYSAACACPAFRGRGPGMQHWPQHLSPLSASNGAL